MCSQRVKFASPFAPLQLSETDVGTLDQLSRVLVSNYVAQYEQYLQDGGSAGIDEREWKHIKQRESVRVFAQRKHRSDGGGIDDIRDSIDGFADSGVLQPSDLPVILTVGSIAGTLDDVMYGSVCPTVEVLRVKASYGANQVADAAVLHTIVKPTESDPFQSLVIKWGLNRLNLLRRSILNNRDLVYMERTGTTHTTSGERLGFHMLHSVHFPQTRELPPTVRSNVSVCCIYRDIPERNQVDLFVRGIIDPRNNAPNTLVIQAAADIFLLVARYVECSYRKKLMWKLRTKKQKNEDFIHKLPFSTDKQISCATCKRPPSRVRNALGDSWSRRCALCTKYICSSCRIKKTLSCVPSATGKLLQREYSFCDACYTESCQSDAFTTALEEFVFLEVNGAGANESFGFRDDLYSFTSNSESS